MKDLKCPCCESNLTITHRDRYQDTGEHVSDPNGTPSMKDGYQCTKAMCVAHLLGATWIEDGGLYMSCPEGIEWDTYLRAKKMFDDDLRYGVNSAIGSWEFYYELGKKEIVKRKKTFHIGRYKIDIEPIMIGGDNVETQYMPHSWKKKFTYWRVSKNETYQHIIPHYRMIKFYISQFNRNYNSALYNPARNKNSIKDCVDKIKSYHWGQPDDRFFSRVASFIIRIFMPARVQVIKNLAKSENLWN